ncbi:MAG: class I SAM-dependent methyltransferase, partial [Dermatophilaceae bacterium]
MAIRTESVIERWRSLWEQRGRGWDLDQPEGRIEEESPPWDYEELVRHELGFAGSALDLGTGRGEFLSSLEDDLPVEMHATVRCAVDVPLAREALAPLGVEIREHDALSGDPLPFPDACVDVVLSRHEPFMAVEVARVLRPGGWLVAQQLEEHHLGDRTE